MLITMVKIYTDFDDLKAKIESISSADLKEMANMYFKDDHYLKVILMPEVAEE